MLVYLFAVLVLGYLLAHGVPSMLAFALEKERNLQPVCALVEAQLIFAELSAATSAGSPCDIGTNCHPASKRRAVDEG